MHNTFPLSELIPCFIQITVNPPNKVPQHLCVTSIFNKQFLKMKLSL